MDLSMEFKLSQVMIDSSKSNWLFTQIALNDDVVVVVTGEGGAPGY
jgi:hypothetical protein